MSSILNKGDSKNSLRYLYIGSVLPDLPEFDGRSFSRAGSMWQENLLSAINAGNLPIPDAIYSYKQVESYPRSLKFLIRSEITRLKCGLLVSLLPFINVTPFKQILIGIFAAIKVILWSLHTPNKFYKFVYLYNLSVPPAIFIYIACRLSRVKLIVSINDIDIPGVTVPNTLYRKIEFFINKHLIPYLDGHIVVADKIIKDFAPNVSYLRMEGGVSEEVLSNFLDLRVNSSIETNFKGTFKIVSFGSLDEMNGFRILIEAFNLLKLNSIHDVELYIAGKGPLESYVKDASEKIEGIKYLGYLDYNSVLDYYSQADLLINMRITNAINSSYFFPSKLLEYLSTGVPVLTTQVGHSRDELQDYVYFLNEETPQELANLINIIINVDPIERHNKAISALRYVHRHKTWLAQAHKVFNYINLHIKNK